MGATPFTPDAGRTSRVRRPSEQAARNILAQIQGRPMRAFRYVDKGPVATIGRRAAVLDAFGMLSVGLLSGGYGEDELGRAGAFRVYRDPADLHRSLDELGIVP